MKLFLAKPSQKSDHVKTSDVTLQSLQRRQLPGACHHSTTRGNSEFWKLLLRAVHMVISLTINIRAALTQKEVGTNKNRFQILL